MKDLIDVENQRPPVGKEVLCYGHHFNGAGAYHLAARMKDKPNDGWGYTHTCFTVTHWCELPNAPAL